MPTPRKPRKSRILPLFSPAAALYLVADAASAVHGLTTVEWLVSVLAVAMSATPLWLRGLVEGEVKGARRTALLGVLFGLGLAAGLGREALSLTRDLTLACVLAGSGALLVDLALRVPDKITSRGRGLLVLGTISATAMGIAATLPQFEVFGELVLAPSRMLYAPPAAALIGGLVALVMRLLRRRLGSPPEALASSAWAVMGLIPGTACSVAAFVLVYRGNLHVGSGWVSGLVSVGVLFVLFGHIASIDPRRRPRAGRALRGYVAAGLTAVMMAVGAAAAWYVLPRDPTSFGVAAAVVWLASLAVWSYGKRITHRLLAPYGGRLLDSLTRAEVDLAAATSLAEIAGSVLSPLRDASGDRESNPVLWTADPGREASLDAARNPRVRTATFPPSLTRAFDESAVKVIVAREVHASVVRRPDIRALAELLESHDALCVVPLAVGPDLEGALLLPRGRRGTALSLEEIDGLRELGARVAAQVSLVTARDRAQRKVAELATQKDRLEEQVEDTQDARDRLKADARALSEGRGASRRAIAPVAYSESMRTLGERIDDVAPMEVPVALVAEGGSPVDRVARRIHLKSPRAEGPFVVADCARAGDAELALFGDDVQPGWVRLAEGGTLLLADVPALGIAAQKALAEALAVRQARPAHSGGAYPIDLRVIATTRVPLDPLAEQGVFDPELARWLTRAVLDVPPLRQRGDDIPSLVLLALDRACRVLGRPAVGIDQAAMDVLLGHAWPGNLRELQHVVDRAVAHASGTKVGRADLPSLAKPTVTMTDPLDGTYAELERRVLERAMKKANGNKSEAARVLGLKRTTFLDKLRRHGIDAKKGDAEDAA